MRPGPTARAAAVLVVFFALFIAVDRLSGPRSPRSVTASASTRPAASTTSRPVATATSRAPASTTPSTAATTSRPTRSTRPTRPTGTTLRSPEGVTVQVLNAVFVPGLARRVADRIRRAGYDVIAVHTAFGTYTVSRIYYTDGHKADAEAFQARFPAFRMILPASQSRTGLDRGVALHVVIGQNYQDLDQQ